MNKKYTKEDLSSALDEIKKGKSTNAVSKKFGIPRTTLQDKKFGRHANDTGAPTILSKDEEKIIVKWIIELAGKGFPVTKEQLLHSVTNLINNLKKKNNFKDGVPGRSWYSGFLKRNPEVAVRVSQNLTPGRAAISEEAIRNWFQKVASYFDSYPELREILNCPDRIFNCDETAFFLCPSNNKVLVRKGSCHTYNRTANDEKECITVLIGASANGKLMPPLTLFPYKRIPATIISKMPKTWCIGKTDSGWMTCIILVALLPNSTHLLQPMDVAVFRPLKQSWRTKVTNWKIQNNGNKIKREDFSELVDQCLKESAKVETIHNGFRVCGLYPFNPDAVDFDKVLQDNNKNISQDGVENITSTPNQIDNLNQPDKNYNHFVIMLEEEIGFEKLETFKKNRGLLWLGHREDESLFYLWQKSIKNFTNSTVLATYDEINNETMLSELLVSNNVDVLDLVQNEKENLCVPNPTAQNEPEINTINEYPSPFKKALYWPKKSEPPKKQTVRRRMTPVVATADEFLKYQIRMDDEKKEKEDRKAKKMEKKNKINSNEEPEEEHSIIINVGDYVVVDYEMEKFPGMVLEAENKEKYSIKTMTMSGLNWRWPEKDDILVYPKKDILKKINPPLLLNSRGIYSISDFN